MAWTVYSYRNQDSRADSDADYRIVGKWISDNLTALGWGKTADTGQIDWSTATRPGAPTSNTKGGYEIRVSSGAGTDIYAKITYGMGYNTSCIGIWLLCGEGSDGAGTLTGDQTTEAQIGSAVGTTSPYDSTWYVTGDTDNFQIAATESAVANGFVAGVQRTCDANGADTNTGWWQYGVGYANALYGKCQYVGFSSGAAAQDANPGYAMFAPIRNLTSTLSVPVYPIYGQDGSSWIMLRDICALMPAYQYVEFEASLYGTSRRYKVPMVGTNSYWFGGTTLPANGGVGFRLT